MALRVVFDGFDWSFAVAFFFGVTEVGGHFLGVGLCRFVRFQVEFEEAFGFCVLVACGRCRKLCVYIHFTEIFGAGGEEIPVCYRQNLRLTLLSLHVYFFSNHPFLGLLLKVLRSSLQVEHK